ncbi:uncharacterized protein LOC117948042 [Etheostoma cragini]|uniref:uncharacterized protein LOC117948042 n=1 Tax=Etheostoma cragini TaxID=417921 RepID=UPI00155F0D06|nr:uncharacterized protein LOC117948042 [Etheostoma cragini]
MRRKARGKPLHRTRVTVPYLFGPGPVEVTRGSSLIPAAVATTQHHCQLSDKATGSAIRRLGFLVKQCSRLVAKKFDIPTLDLKVYDESQTEVDKKVFEFLLLKQDLGVLEICLPQSSNLDDLLSSPASSSFANLSGDNSKDSDDTILLQQSPDTRKRAEDARLGQMIEGVLKNKPGGERILNEYARTKTLTDSRRRDMVKILVAHMTSEHGM